MRGLNTVGYKLMDFVDNFAGEKINMPEVLDILQQQITRFTNFWAQILAFASYIVQIFDLTP